MPTYSHSRLETFRNCPLKYKFNYIDGIKREEEGIEAFLGSRFHEVMEMLYRDINFKVYTLKELVECYNQSWEKEYHDAIVVTKKDRTPADYKKLGQKCIEDYYQRYHPFNQSRVLGLEKEVIVDLSGEGKYKIRGYIDRISQLKDGTYEIHDYKTSSRLPEQAYLKEDKQLALYQIALENLWNDVRDVKLIWHYVMFDKELSSTRTPDKLDSLKKDIITLIDKIDGLTPEEFLPQESALCAWCEYQNLCPKRKHFFQVEALPVNKYLKDDGVKLVNKYLSIKDKIREHSDQIDELKLELEEIEQATMQYAEKQNIDIITGSDYKLKINSKEKVIIPSKNSSEREKLEQVLKEANKLEEVSSLDAYAVKDKIVNKSWDKKLLDKIKGFIKIENAKSVSLSKLKEKEK